MSAISAFSDCGYRCRCSFSIQVRRAFSVLDFAPGIWSSLALNDSRILSIYAVAPPGIDRSLVASALAVFMYNFFITTFDCQGDSQGGYIYALARPGAQGTFKNCLNQLDSQLANTKWRYIKYLHV